MDETPTPIEDRLRDALDAAIALTEAADGAPVADPADLARRRIRHHRRQRAGRVAAAAAVVLVAAVGGWAVGLGSEEPADVEDVAAEADTEATEGMETTIPSPPTVDPSRLTVDPDGVPIVVPQPPDPGVDSGAAARTASGSYTSRPPTQPWYSSAPLPTALVSSRTLDDGTRVEVRTNRYDPAVYELPPFWEPPAWCFPTGDVEIRTAAAGWAATTLTVRYAAAEDGTVDVRSRIVGSDGGDPHWVTVVHGPAGTASVRIDYPGGTADEAEPVDGLAVLSAPVADLDDDVPVVAVATAEDGTELARSEAPWDADELGAPAADPPSERAACAVPTDLPAPGPEQPADPAAAEAAVLAVWDATFGRPAEVTVEEQLAAVTDTRGVRPALQKVREGVSPQVLSETTIAIDDLVFTRPDQVFVHYTVVIATGTYADLYGELVLVDGTWKVSRQTVCDLAETGGGICQPLTDG